MADRSVELEFNTNLDDIEKQIGSLESKLKDIQSRGLTLDLSFDATKISTELNRLKSEFNLDKSIANIIGPKESYSALQTTINNLLKRMDELKAKSELLTSQYKQQTRMFGESEIKVAQQTKKELDSVNAEMLKTERALTQATNAETKARTEARRAADKAAVDEEKAAQDKMLGTFKGYQNKANEIIMQFERASAGSINASDIEAAKNAYNDLFNRISSFLDNPLVRFNESISANALSTQDKIMSMMESISNYELKTARDTANKEKAEKLEEYQAYQKARLRVTNEYSKITEAYEGKSLETFDESKIKSDIELLKKLRAETKASFDYEAITEQEQHDLNNLTKMIDNRVRLLEENLTVRAKNAAKADSKARADAEAEVNNEIKETRQKFYNDLNTEMQKYGASAKLDGFSDDEINASISNIEKLKKSYREVFETDQMTEAEREQLIAFIKAANVQIKSLDVERTKRSDEEKRKEDKDRADKAKADKERERQQMAALHSYYDQVHELEAEERKRQEADAAQKAKEDKEKEKQQLAAMHSYYEQVHALEEEQHKQSVKNRQDAVNGIKDLAKLYSDTINSTITTIRNGYKTIKSLTTNLSSILGIEDVQLNVNSILKQSLSTYAGVYESTNLLDQMYEKDISTMLSWAENQAKAYGIASQSAREYLGQISGMLSNLGIESDSVRETMTTNYVKMAGDLASAFNKSTDQAFLAIRSGIAGMTRPLEQFGINLKITALDEWVKNNDKIHKQLGNIAYKDLTEANKQMVRYAYILEKAHESQGDFAKTSASFSNEIKTLKNEWQNLLELIGKYAVPVFRPVVEWIIKAIQFTKYFIQVLAETFGWQIEQEQDTVKFYQEETQATEDTTKAIEDKNKALKKGVKLLDLYELDFGDDDDNTGSDIGAASVPQDLLDGLADEYRDLDFDFGFKLTNKDKEAVKKLVEDIKNLIKELWTTEGLFGLSLEQIFNDAVKKFKNRPGEFIVDIIGAIFTEKALKKCTAIAGNYLTKVLSSDNVKEALKNPTVADRLAGIGMGVIGLIESGFGGYNLGQAILDGNSIDTLTGAFESISGIMTSTMGGLMAGGPVGAAVGFTLSTLEVAATTVWGIMDEAKKHGEDTYGSLKTLGVDFSNSYSEAMQTLIDASPYDTLDNQLAVYNRTYHENVDPIVDTEIPRLVKAYTDSADDAEKKSILLTLEKEYEDLYDAASKYKTDSFKSELSASFGLFAVGAEQIGISIEQMNKFMEKYEAAHAQYIASQKEEFARLSAKEATAPDSLTDDERRHLEGLKAYLSVDKEITEQTRAQVYSVESLTREYSNLYSSGTDAVKQIDTANKNLLTFLQSTGKYTDEELSKLGSEIKEFGTIVSGNYLARLSENELYLFRSGLSKIYAETEGLSQINNTISNVSDNLQSTVKTITSLGNLEAVLSTWEGGLLGLGSSLPEYEKIVDDWASIVSDMDLTDIQNAINELPEGFTLDALGEKTQNAAIAAVEKGIRAPLSDENREKLAAAVAYMASQQTTTFGMLYWQEAYKDIQSSDYYASGTKQIVKNVRDSATNSLVADLRLHGIEVDVGNILGGSNTGITIRGLKTIDSDWSKVKYSDQTIKAIKSFIETNSTDAIESGTADAAANADTSEAAKTTADNYTNKTAEEIEKDADKLTAATSNAIATAANTEEAKQKGSELGNAYMDGLATAINTNSNYKTALQQLVDGFKNALNSISSNINEWSKHLSDGVAALNIPDDVTFSSLMGILKTNNLNIKPLATGGVIPPNNPFIAMLGDQRSGVNIEAPLTTIQDAVREVVQPEQNIEVSVYIGNQELRDFVVDTVVDNNLIKG